MGMIGWQTEVVLQLSVGIILTSAFGYFGVDENVKFSIPNETKTILRSQNSKPSFHLTPIKNLTP
jgi:hypothetical protein